MGRLGQLLAVLMRRPGRPQYCVSNGKGHESGCIDVVQYGILTGCEKISRHKDHETQQWIPRRRIDAINHEVISRELLFLEWIYT